MGLFVRDECERLVKNQASKKNQCNLCLACEKATCEKATCETHDWKLKNHASLSFREYFARNAIV